MHSQRDACWGLDSERPTLELIRNTLQASRERQKKNSPGHMGRMHRLGSSSRSSSDTITAGWPHVDTVFKDKSPERPLSLPPTAPKKVRLREVKRSAQGPTADP